jgi:hypothetical protein
MRSCRSRSAPRQKQKQKQKQKLKLPLCLPLLLLLLALLSDESLATETETATTETTTTETTTTETLECFIWLAPSTLEGAGLGMFAGRHFDEAEDLQAVGDLVVPIVDLQAHNHPER